MMRLGRKRNHAGRFALGQFMDQPVPHKDHGQPMRSSWVYAIACDGGTKVGVAGNVKKRLAELAIGNPRTVRLLARRRLPSAVYALLAERHIHRMLQAYHLRGEWFAAPDGKVRATLSLVCAATRALHYKHWGTQPRYTFSELAGASLRPAKPLTALPHSGRS